MSSARDTLLRAATERLRGSGVASPRVDAELLLAHCLDSERSRLSLVDDVPDPVAHQFSALVERRAQRLPLQHILGSAAFRYVDLLVGQGVFVPRPETELLVDAVLPVLVAIKTPVVVDLCAGSGALALAIAHEVPAARVYAVEKYGAALRWLHRNGDGQIDVVVGDVADAMLLRELSGRADVVVSNPPYVPLRTPVAPEVQADPAEAVFAGDDGLELMPAVIERAASLLRAGGVLAVEHDDSHAQAVPQLLRAAGDWCEVADHADLAGRPRYATAVRI